MSAKLAELDRETLLIVSICQQVFQLKGREADDPAEYVREYARHIKVLGQLLEYLGLATLEPKTPLGWKPTDDLIEMIATKAAHLSKSRPKSVYQGDYVLIDLLFDEVFGKDGHGSPGRHPSPNLAFMGEFVTADVKETMWRIENGE
jgi:hypothetical protein